MSKTLTCSCGQTVDIETIAPGAAVQCPACQNSLTVPAAAPPIAMAAADEDSDLDFPPAAAKRKLSPAEEQKQKERLAARRSQRALMKIMLWPAAIFGLVALGIAAMGVLGELGMGWLKPVEKAIEIRTDANGLQHLYALDPTPNAPPHQYIEVQPDIIPGDSAKRDADDNLVYQLNGQPIKSQSGSRWLVTLLEKGGEKRQATIERHGLWFYEIDSANGKIVKKLDNLPLMAEEREDADYVPVDTPQVAGNSIVFNRRGSDPSVAVDVVYFHVEDGMQTDKLGKFKEPVTDFFTGLRGMLWIFIAAGLLVGLILLAAAAFFAQQCYFSKEAKARAA